MNRIGRSDGPATRRHVTYQAARHQATRHSGFSRYSCSRYVDQLMYPSSRAQMTNPMSAHKLALPNGIFRAKSSVKTRRKMMETTIPNTENALAIQYFLGKLADSRPGALDDKMGK
jgi:hypothetical protein